MLEYRRLIVELVIARVGGELLVTVDGKEEFRYPLDDERTLEALPVMASLTIDWGAALAAPPFDVEKIPQVAIEVREAKWSGIDWETMIAPPGPPFANIRTSRSRPRVLDKRFTFPARMLYVGATAPANDYIADAFRGHDPSMAAVSAHGDLDTALSVATREKWPTVEILHFMDLGERLSPEELLSTSRADVPGTIGWIGRHADFWQTRLIVFEATEASRARLMRAAHRIVARGGPAVWVVPAGASELFSLYEFLFHDRPFDWIQRELQAWVPGFRLFAGAGREDALRFSALAAALTDKDTVRQISDEMIFEPFRIQIRTVKVEDISRTVIDRATRFPRVTMQLDLLPLRQRRLLFEQVRRELIPFGVTTSTGELTTLIEQSRTVPELRERLSGVLVEVAPQRAPSYAPGAATTTIQVPVMFPPAGPAQRLSARARLVRIRDLTPKLRFEEHESKGVLPMARALQRVRARATFARPVEPKPVERHVNRGLFDMDAEGQLIARAQANAPLARDRIVYLGVQIGSLKKDFGKIVGASALVEEPFNWAENADGVGLEVAVTPLDFELFGEPVQELWLPAMGETERITFALRPRTDTAIAGVARLRFTLFYRNNIVQSFRLAALLFGYEGDDAQLLARALDSDEKAVGRVSFASRLEYSTGRGFANPDEIEKRELTIVANDSAGQKAASLKADDFFESVVDNNIGTQVGNARVSLERAAGGGGLYRYAADNQGTEKDFETYLPAVAQAGWDLYSTVLPNSDHREALRSILAKQTTIHAAHMDLTQVVPWTLVYDRVFDTKHLKHYENPRDPNARVFKVQPALCKATMPSADGVIPEVVCGQHPDCPLSAVRNDPLKAKGEIHCPESVVCPAHFWGFRHNIELPVQQVDGRRTPPLSKVVNSASPTRILAAFARSLPAFQAHETRITQTITKAMPQAGIEPPVFYEHDRLQQALKLKDVEADILYLYCHAEDATKQANGTITPPRLNFGKPGELSETLTAVQFDGGDWKNSPLVFLNGCATLGFSPIAPSDFIIKFVRGRKAAAVIGTEVTIWEPLADAVANDFMESFLAGKSAGEALLRARRKLLAKFNPLGLVYTLYGSADLILQPATASKKPASG